MNQGRFTPQLAGPKCDFCHQPKMVCYTDPCAGLRGHCADIILNATTSPAIRRTSPAVRLVKGGQGHRGTDIQDQANTVFILGFVLAVVCALAAWGVR